MKAQLVVLAALAQMIKGDDVSALTGLYGDISAHVSDYLSYVQAGHALPSGLLNLYQQVQTYTDDSYTSLLSAVDFSQVESFATELPWYSSRLETIFAEATAGSGSASASASETASSGESSSVLASSAVSSVASSQASALSSITSKASSSDASSAAKSSGSESSSKASSSSKAESSGSGSGSVGSASSTSSSSGFGFSVKQQSSEIVYYMIPFMMVLAAPALL